MIKDVRCDFLLEGVILDQGVVLFNSPKTDNHQLRLKYQVLKYTVFSIQPLKMLGTEPYFNHLHKTGPLNGLKFRDLQQGRYATI